MLKLRESVQKKSFTKQNVDKDIIKNIIHSNSSFNLESAFYVPEE
jgi:hypothetical protein